MASQNNSDKDIIPMGKAIAIIISVVLILVALLIGGGIFVLLSLNSSNGGISNGSKNDNEKIIGVWAEIDDDGKIKKTSGVDIKDVEEYGYKSSSDALYQDTIRILQGKKPLIKTREENYYTITFKRDGSYIIIVPQFHFEGIDFDYVYDEGTYILKGTTLTLYPDTGKEKTHKVEIDSNKLTIDGRTYRGT